MQYGRFGVVEAKKDSVGRYYGLYEQLQFATAQSEQYAFDRFCPPKDFGRPKAYV